MTEQISVWSLVANAGVLVQIVMGILLCASVVSWAMIAERFLYFTSVRASLRAFEKQFWSGIDLNQLYRQGNNKADVGQVAIGSENLFRAGFKEFTRLRQTPGVDPDAVMEGTQRAMRVAMSKELEKIESNLPFLATVGSISPYIGLFGTVWGIMNSFRGLANVHQATLATVAPGISEALIATAMGLFAAIPAVIAYNRYSAIADRMLSNYETFAEEFSSILHRQAHKK